MLTLHELLPVVALALTLLLMGSALIGDRRHQRNVIFACVTFGLSIWNLGVLGLRLTNDPGAAVTWERVVHFGIIPVPVLFYHYVLVFLEARRGPMLVLGYGLALGFMLVSPDARFLRGVQSSAWGFMPDVGPLYGPFVVYCYAYLGLGLVCLIHAYRGMPSAFRRNRTRFVILGACATILGGAVDILRFILGWDWLYPVGVPSNAVFTICLAIAIVRYRLWDVSILAKRIVLYAVMSLGMVPVVALGALYMIDAVSPHDEWWPNLPVVFLLVAIVASLLPFLRRVEVAFERFIFARQHGVREALGALSKDMTATLDLHQLGRGLTEGLVERVPVGQAAFYVRDEASGEFTCFTRAISPAFDGAPAETRLDPHAVLWLRLADKPLTVEDAVYQASHDPKMVALAARLEAAKTAVLVPLVLDGELTAILVLGEKLSGGVFDSGELELIETLVAQAGIALRNAYLYRNLQRQMEELKAAHQQLIQAAKLAAIGELAASVAHELNNPLTVIVGHSDYLLRKATPGSIPGDLVETIRTEALRAGRITRGLLDFARRREPKREPLNVNALVRSALELTHAKLRGQGIGIDTALESTVPVLLGDGDQLLQVLINLIGNAVDAMPEGGRLVVTTQTPPAADAVLVSVKDTGIGMTADQVSRIFEPFYTTKPEGKGTGLGLSVTLEIVKNHGGTIRVESAPGEGTVMSVILPLSSVTEPVSHGGRR